MAVVKKGQAFVDKTSRPQNVSLPKVGNAKVPTTVVSHDTLMKDAKNTFKKNNLKGNTSR